MNEWAAAAAAAAPDECVALLGLVWCDEKGLLPLRSLTNGGIGHMEKKVPAFVTSKSYVPLSSEKKNHTYSLAFLFSSIYTV